MAEPLSHQEPLTPKQRKKIALFWIATLGFFALSIIALVWSIASLLAGTGSVAVFVVCLVCFFLTTAFTGISISNIISITRDERELNTMLARYRPQESSP